MSRLNVLIFSSWFLIKLPDGLREVVVPRKEVVGAWTGSGKFDVFVVDFFVVIGQLEEDEN
jgi:hypothetical protein